MEWFFEFTFLDDEPYLCKSMKFNLGISSIQNGSVICFLSRQLTTFREIYMVSVVGRCQNTLNCKLT